MVNNNNMDRINIRIPHIMNEKIIQISVKTHTTRTEVIRNALRDYLDKKLLMLGDSDGC